MRKQQDFSGLMNDLQAKVKVTEVATPTQQVVPLVNKPTKRKGIDPTKDEPFTFWTSKERMKKLKMLALDQNKSLKDLINSAIDNYLNM